MYAIESFTDSEHEILRRFFTNSDRPVFALINLPEIVKGALFARYSRTHKSLRRIFIDEYYNQPEIGLESLAQQIEYQEDESYIVARRRAEELYDRVFIQYGDDSVAQLGGAHIACEQASAILAKAIERGRLAAYLEQSTRYIAYDRKIADSEHGERYRYQVPPEIMQSSVVDIYNEAMTELFDTYSRIVREMRKYFEGRFPRGSNESNRAYFRALNARACDAARGLLPASTISNIGVFASGQAYEAMLIRMNAHPLAEAREYAQMMLAELRKIIPAFMKRVDVEDRGAAWSRYFSDIRSEMQPVADALTESIPGNKRDFDYQNDEVKLIDWDDNAEIQLVAAALYPYASLSEEELLSIAIKMSDEDRSIALKKYFGNRTNRRHKPGRALERIAYRFDILSDFGSFRDLQRHRMMTIEWQRLTTDHGYSTPPEIEAAGGQILTAWHDAIAKLNDLYQTLRAEAGPDVAQYAVPFAHRIRYSIQLNARQAFHMLELRTSEQGHPDYRRICYRMYELIRDKAKHGFITDAMSYIDSKKYELGRLKAEQKQSDGVQLDFQLD